VTALVDVLEAMADQIRDAIRDADGWEGTQVEAFWIPNPTPPSIDIYLGDPGREVAETGGFAETDAMSAGGEWVNVRARVATNDARSNQKLLVELCDPESEVAVVQALYDDPTLGGLVADVNLESQSGFRPFPTLDGAAFHIGVLWSFLVIPARS
jgi:hypothetical protein